MEKEDMLKIPLKEQENLKELFRLLEKNGMEQEKKQVLQMADYIDSMETKMEDVLSELKSMREQLSGIENQSFRTKAEKIAAAVESKGSTWESEESIPWKSGAGAAGRENKGKGGFVRDPEDHPPAPDDSPCPASPERSSPDCGSGDHETGRYGG